MKPGTQRWLLIGGCLAVLVCAGVVVASAVLLFTVTRTTSIGPTFTTAESLGYNVIYDTEFPAVDPATIRAVQQQTAGAEDELHFVLMGYETAGERRLRPLLARWNGREFFVEPMQPGPTASGDHFDAAVLLHPNERDTEVGVYGRLYNPAIQRVTLTWPNGRQQDAAIAEDTYLWFQSWSPVDGSPIPTSVTAYTATGEAIDSLPLPASMQYSVFSGPVLNTEN